MTNSASCRMPLRILGSLQLGDWARETSDRGGRGGQDKANWRSRTRRRSAITKPLSAHWFLATRRLALKRRLGEGGWHRSNFSNNLNAQRDGARGVHLRGSTFYFDLVRVTAILCDRPIAALAGGLSDEDRQFMAQDQGDDFHVRPGRVGSRGTRINPRGNLRSQPFLKHVQMAVRKAGGDPEQDWPRTGSWCRSREKDKRPVQCAGTWRKSRPFVSS